MINFKEINCPSNTKFSFEMVKDPIKNYKWNIVADGKHVYPFNDGKFTSVDYSNTFTEYHYYTGYWDWLSISRRERRAFRSFYIARCEAMTVEEFRKAYKEMYAPAPAPHPIPFGNLTATEVLALSAPTCTPYRITDGCVTTIPSPTYTSEWGLPQQKGNNPMNYAISGNSLSAVVQADSSEKDKRHYLNVRLNDLQYNKRHDINEMFGFGPVSYPKNAKEALERLQAGKFTIAGADKDDKPRWGFSFEDAFSWRDPAVKQDEEARDNAYSELSDFLDGLKDIVMVKPIDEAFGTIKALQDWQPTGKPN